MQHPLFVVNKDTGDFILGTDLMARFQNWNLDFNTDKLSVAGIQLPLLYTSLGEGVVRLQHDLIIPPNSQIAFLARVTNFDNEVAIFEPDSTTLDACGLKAARALVKPENGMMPVRPLNSLSYPIKLQHGTCLGQIQSIPDPI